jgi:hypothetical protein
VASLRRIPYKLPLIDPRHTWCEPWRRKLDHMKTHDSTAEELTLED